MGYRERLVELYRDQISKTFKIMETGVNFILHKTDGDNKIIVAKLPKNDNPNRAERLCHYLIGYLSSSMAEEVVSKLDASQPQPAPVNPAEASSGRQSSPEHPLE